MLSCEVVNVCVRVCQVMPPQYLEQNDEGSSGGVPVTPSNHGTNLSTSSTLKGVTAFPSSVT